MFQKFFQPNRKGGYKVEKNYAPYLPQKKSLGETLRMPKKLANIFHNFNVEKVNFKASQKKPQQGGKTPPPPDRDRVKYINCRTVA